jgi:serine protease Do
MNTTIKTLAAVITFSMGFTSLQAQDTDIANGSNEENIIIHKKNPTKEKLTIVVSGDNVTVNGKPVDDFKSDDIDITRQDGDMIRGFSLNGDGVQNLAPGMPRLRSLRGEVLRGITITSNQAFLGVMTKKDDLGAKITDVTDGSAAASAGLKEGDVITKIGEDKISGPEDLYKAVGKYKPDDKISITYLRDNKTFTTSATLEKSKQPHVYSWNTPGNDLELRNFNPYNFSFSWDSKPHLGISAQDTEDGNGVKVLDVDGDDSPAAKAGLKEDDIITQVNGKTITSTDDLRESVKDIKKGDTVKITFKRNNQAQTVDVKIPKDLKTIDL